MDGDKKSRERTPGFKPSLEELLKHCLDVAQRGGLNTDIGR
jgi:hypothetical protein